jgi:hypothetical protein
MNAITDPNDLRGGIEYGTVQALTIAGFTAGTRDSYPQNFQQVRPRCDVKARINGATGRRDIRPSDGVLVNNGWRFDLALNVVTILSHDGKEMTHSEMVSQVRKLAQALAQDSWVDSINWPLHAIVECLVETGNNGYSDGKKNEEYTAINFSGKVIIKPGTQY